jgi:hypothetical protein
MSCASWFASVPQPSVTLIPVDSLSLIEFVYIVVNGVTFALGVPPS